MTTLFDGSSVALFEGGSQFRFRAVVESMGTGTGNRWAVEANASVLPGQTILLHFPDSGAIDDFLRSDELTALEIRRDMAAAIKRGAKVVALTQAEQPRALVLRPALNAKDIAILS